MLSSTMINVVGGRSTLVKMKPADFLERFSSGDTEIYMESQWNKGSYIKADLPSVIEMMLNLESGDSILFFEDNGRIVLQ
jgi:hypothetical protein